MDEDGNLTELEAFIKSMCDIIQMAVQTIGGDVSNLSVMAEALHR